MDVHTFCERSVDVMGEESDHIHAQALTDAVQVRQDPLKRRQQSSPVHGLCAARASKQLTLSCMQCRPPVDSWPSCIWTAGCIQDGTIAWPPCVCVRCVMLQVPIRIIYMSAQQGDAPVDMKPEHLTPEQQAALGGPKVHMLYRPGHYDVLYPKEQSL